MAWRIANRHIRDEELASRWTWTTCMEIPEIKDCTTSQWPTFNISRLQAKTACEKKWQSQSHAYSHRSSHPSCEITHRTSIPQHRLKRLLKRDFNIQTQSVANKQCFIILNIMLLQEILELFFNTSKLHALHVPKSFSHSFCKVLMKVLPSNASVYFVMLIIYWH